MFNKQILQAYATKYGFKIEDVEAECKQMVEILVRYKFFYVYSSRCSKRRVYKYYSDDRYNYWFVWER